MPIITLSRGSKTGGATLAKLLSEELKCYNLISREVLVKASEEYGITEDILSEAMDKPPKFWERSSGNPRRMYLTLIRAALLEYAAQGCMIYHGHAGQFLLSDINWVLKVRLIAPLARRVDMMQVAMDIDRPDAIQYIQKVDDDRLRWTRFLYNEDLTNPTHFDTVINLQTMSPETACQAVAFLAKAEEFMRTPERDREMKNKAIEARVLATLEVNEKTRGIEITATADGGEITLSGRVAHDNIRQIIIEIGSSVKGVEKVQDKIVT